MANSKSVIELPRFLRPSQPSFSRITPSALASTATATQAHRRPPFPASVIHRPAQSTSFSTLGNSSPSPSAPVRPSNPITTLPYALRYTLLTPVPTNRREPDISSVPIRHNGVYVATFKPARRAFHASASREKDHRFDTLKLVQRLKSEGFSEEQAVALMRVLNDVIEESIQNLTRTMVLREDAERSAYTQKVDFAKLRSELLNSDSTEAQLTRSSHDRIAGDLAKLNSRLRDEISRTQASVRLDLNLEKGRIREEANGQEMRIKETETRIEQEVAGVRERVEAVKFSTLQWLMGVCTGTAALILGAWRLLM
ncbi:Protein fmp32, mitochondrial [Emydomyces testavorans]|uniref:Protein fmp32, mitochondrial n=1 Tax=Emydomyces testavorans TaxID=2070801 RepID=A0AAF0DLE5_9EURO|nr:Protein fmp32, mitochondrial [Emydomyces testavorans]